MSENLDKFLWYTDLHLNRVPPWTLFRFLRHLKNERPKGLILTGDISNALFLEWHLKLLAKHVECPIYFCLGNHCYHWSSIDKVHDKIRKLCIQYPNLIWMTEAGVQHINEEVCFIGHEGWYDAENGNPAYLRLTHDWFLTKDFRQMKSMEERIEYWRQMAYESGQDIAKKLQEAISKDYKTIYVLTHFPPFKEATRDIGTFWEPFWLPYNANVAMGKAILKVMDQHKKKNVICLTGHVHVASYCRMSRNVMCQVGEAKLFNVHSQIIFV